MKSDVSGAIVLEPNLRSGMVLPLAGGLLLAVIVGVFFSLQYSSAVGMMAGLMAYVALNLAVYFNLRSIEYRFESDQIEYNEGFINLRQNNVAYSRITDVSLSQPIIQRFFGTGTIKINTAGSDAREIKLKYIDSPEEVYEEVKKIVE